MEKNFILKGEIMGDGRSVSMHICFEVWDRDIWI